MKEAHCHNINQDQPIVSTKPYLYITQTSIPIYYSTPPANKPSITKAEEHFKYWFDRADSFLNRFNLMFEQKRFTDAAFDLHQIAESCYKGILMVFTNRMPREHFLEILGKEAQKHHAEIKNIFPNSSKEDEYHFKLLEYAYIGGRYDPLYRISKKELKILLTKVKKLLKVSKKICKKRIETILISKSHSNQ